MKTFLPILTLVLLSFSSIAQLTFPEDMYIEEAPTINDIEYQIQISNTSSEEIKVFWELVEDDNFNKNWETYLCDINLCYTPFVRNCPTSSPNVFQANVDTLWRLHLKPENSSGQGVLTLRVFYVQDSGDSTLVDYPISIDISNTSNVLDIDLAELLIYPNPATDYIQIRNDESIKQINVYNVVGKQLRSFNHVAGQSHSVQDLNKGIYLVRLMNSQGEVIKSMKLSKR